MKILITGNLGYIGSVLSRRLISRGHKVWGFDSGYFQDCVLGEQPDDPVTVLGDIRDITQENLVGYDAVIHLAGLSNDPLGEFAPLLTYEINRDATVRLAQLARDVGVGRFIFASSQSMYGVSDSAAELDEDLSVKEPVTAYARSKWEAEEAVRSMNDPSFVTVCLRPSTVYGWSPRLRCDIVFNNLLGRAFTTNEIRLRSDGTPWRPVLHIQDACTAFEAVLSAPADLVGGRSYNVGPRNGNYSVRDLAEAAARLVPTSTISFANSLESDPRTYRVSFKRIHADLSDSFETKWDLKSGGEEMIEQWSRCDFSTADFLGPTCNRLQQLQMLLEIGKLREDLRLVNEY